MKSIVARFSMSTQYASGLCTGGISIRRLVMEVPFDNAVNIFPRTGVLEILEELERILRCNPSAASAKDSITPRQRIGL